MDGCSIQEIAKQTKVNWRTAKKYADRENWNKGFEVHERRFLILGECTEIIDTWLTEDGSRPFCTTMLNRRSNLISSDGCIE
jgi:hypothetical protein